MSQVIGLILSLANSEEESETSCLPTSLVVRQNLEVMAQFPLSLGPTFLVASIRSRG